MPQAIRWRIRCAVCKQFFSWEGLAPRDMPPSMHRLCRDNGRIDEPRKCPTPWKKEWATADGAQLFINEKFPPNIMIAPYRCRCQLLHIGRVFAVCEAKKYDDEWTINSEEKIAKKVAARMEHRHYARLPLKADAA